MRDGWQRVTLGEVATQRKDFTAVDPDESYTILGVQRSGIGFVRRDPIKGSDQKFTKLMKLREDDLVYRTITAFEAPSAVAGSGEASYYVTPQTFPVFTLDKAQIAPGYMRALTTWPSFHKEMAERCTGSVLRRKTLSVSAFKSIPIVLPPLREQERIVDLIATLDTTIHNAENEAVAVGRMHAALGNQFVCSATKTAPLGDLGRLLRGAVWSKSDESGVAADGHEEVVGISVTGADGLDLSKMKYVSGLGEKVHRLESSDLIMVSSNGNPDRIGNVYEAEALRGRPFSAFQMVFRPGAPEWRDLVFEALASPSIQVALTEMTAGSTGLKNLSVKKLRGLDVPDPREGGDIEPIRVARAAAARAHEAAAHLRALRANLLTVLLSGEHEIPESYNELMGVAS